MYDDTSYNTYNQNQRPHRQPLITAAMFLGILSLLSNMMIYVSLPCGALAIILALVSKTDRSLLKKAKIGLACGMIGLVSTVIITVSAFYFVLGNSEMRSALEYYCQIYMGDYNFDLDEFLEEMFPFIGDLDTPALNIPGFDNLPGGADSSEPVVIEPKGDGTFL